MTDPLRFNSILKELENRASHSAHPLEKRLLETTIWYHKNLPHIPRDNLKMRLDFLEKYCDCMIENFAWMVERLQEEKGSKLWIPSGMNGSGDMTKFG